MASNRFTVAVIFVLFAVINVALGKKVQSNLLRSNLNKKVTHDNSDTLASVKDSKGEWIKCENGQRKKGLQRSACRLKKDGEGKEQEFIGRIILRKQDYIEGDGSQKTERNIFLLDIRRVIKVQLIYLLIGEVLLIQVQERSGLVVVLRNLLNI